MNMSALWKLSYGMYALTAMDGNRPTGCIINTAVQVTSQNPTIAISLNRNNYTYDVIKNPASLLYQLFQKKLLKMSLPDWAFAPVVTQINLLRLSLPGKCAMVCRLLPIRPAPILLLRY